MVAVRIYVEGGGPGPAAEDCRKGFSAFFGKIVPPGRRPRIIACGSRSDAFDNFARAVQTHRNAVCILLVDSEGPVEDGHGPWQHLAACDNCRKPDGVDDDHAHLMVQCMEAWLVTDPETLAGHFGQGFNAGALPRHANIEEVAKPDLFVALAAAVRNVGKKGGYHKVRDGFALLARIDPERVRQRSPHHAERLFATLVRLASNG